MGEGGFNAATRVIEHPDRRRVLGRQSRGCTRQIQFDHLGRAGAHQKKQFDLGATRQQLGHNAVEFDIGVGQAGQVPFVNDGCGKTGFCKNHDAGGRLNQMGAGARPHHQEKCILDFAVQPDDAGQTAKHLVLSALSQHRRITATACGDNGYRESYGAHAAAKFVALPKRASSRWRAS